MEIVGGSTIEIHLSSAGHISQDVDVVGRKDRITPALRRSKFQAFGVPLLPRHVMFEKV